MEFNFDIWQKALEDFQRSVTKDLEEIRQHKEEVSQLKAEIFNKAGQGYYLRDNKRIVISAPEIIIGNVDADGVLNADAGSTIILRGRGVSLEGVGEGGSVTAKAPSIRQIAVDPGIDGEEAVVGAVSEVISQAGSIVIDGRQSEGVFSRPPGSAGIGGVKIHADGNLVIDASLSAGNRQKEIENLLKDLEQQKSAVSSQVSDGIKSFKDLSSALEDLYKNQEEALTDAASVRTETAFLNDNGQNFQILTQSLYNCFDGCIRSLSRLGELNRQITCLKAEKDAIPKDDAFKKNPTGAAISVIGERVDIVSKDGDGNIRDNEGSGVGILANNVKVEAIDATKALQKEGKILLHAMGVEVSTANTKDEKYDDKSVLQSGEYPAEGEVIVHSKTVSIEAVDQEFKDNKMTEKAFTKDGAFSIRAEKVDVSATDTEGKATGSISLNAKDISVRSMDVEKEKRTDDKLAAGSSMLLVSEKMFIGAKKKDVKSKSLQAVSEELGLFADKTLEAQQDSGKALLQLAGGKTALGGSDTQVYGKTTVNNTLEAKGEFKAPKATIDHVEAKSSFKSSNISDGIPIPPAPASANLSAKLKAEDAPEKK